MLALLPSTQQDKYWDGKILETNAVDGDFKLGKAFPRPSRILVISKQSTFSSFATMPRVF